MKISIYDNNEKLAYNPNTMKNVGVGGTQTIIIEVAKELVKRGHDVTVYIKCNFPDIYDGVKYYQYYDYKTSNEDILIGFESLPKIHNAKKVFNWSTRVAIDDVIKHLDIDKLIVLSEWHRDRYASELPQELVKKIVVIEPGVSKNFFQPETKKWHKSITYAGHPYKGGMKALIEFAKRLKPKMKDAQIHVHGSGCLWGWDDRQFRPLYDELIHNKILYHGGRSSGKKRLILQLNGSEIFLYPVGRHFQETFGMVVLEAMATGCVVIASDNGAIKSVVGDAGYIIPGNVEDYKWHIEAVEKTLELFNNYTLMLEISKKAKKRAKEFSWEKTVDKLEKLF
jgi:glycosyltransferase involved in cell wall biosynthesis